MRHVGLKILIMKRKQYKSTGVQKQTHTHTPHIINAKHTIGGIPIPITWQETLSFANSSSGDSEDIKGHAERNRKLVSVR